VLCFVQPASKFDTRYTTLGFNDTAQLDDGAMWPASFAVMSIGQAEESPTAHREAETAKAHRG